MDKMKDLGTNASTAKENKKIFRKMEFDQLNKSSSEFSDIIAGIDNKSNLSARIWYIYEKKRMMNMNKDRRKVNTDMYKIRYDELSGFIYWLIETIRLCLQYRHMKVKNYPLLFHIFVGWD